MTGAHCLDLAPNSDLPNPSEEGEKEERRMKEGKGGHEN